MLFSKYW